jgi:hypothetical protein
VLLPGPKPHNLDSDNTAAEEDSKDSSAAPPVACPPLLLLPLLVLPDEAAAEMQQAWQAAAAAIADSAPAGSAEDDATVVIAADENSTVAGLTAAAASSNELAVAWAGVVASLTVDIAYVLSACSAANGPAAPATASTSTTSAAAEQPMPLPAGVSAVLCNVLQHLAASGMFHTMQFLVQTATEATAGRVTSANNSVAASSSSSSSSSSSDDSGDEDGGVDTSNIPHTPGRGSVGNLSRSSSSAAPTARMAGSRGGNSNSSSRDSCCEVVDGCSGDPNGRTLGTWDIIKSHGARATAEECGATAACKGGKLAAASAVQPASALLRQLLCGFTDKAVESRFMAATFSNTAFLDLVTAVYCVAMGVGCWFAAGGKHATPQQHHQQQQAVADQAVGDANVQGSWGVKMVWSVAVVLVLNIATSVAVWLLRLRVDRAAKRKRRQQHLQSSGAGSSSKAQLISTVDGDSAAAATNTLYARAGFQRQQLLALWIVQAIVLDLLCASGAVVTPGMMVRAWGLAGRAQMAACVLGLSMKAWSYQVRRRSPTLYMFSIWFFRGVLTVLPGRTFTRHILASYRIPHAC